MVILCAFRNPHPLDGHIRNTNITPDQSLPNYFSNLIKNESEKSIKNEKILKSVSSKEKVGSSLSTTVDKYLFQALNYASLNEYVAPVTKCDVETQSEYVIRCDNCTNLKYTF